MANHMPSKMGGNGQKKAGSTKPATPSDKKIPLKELVARVLAKSSRPLTTKELANKVLATGYETKSKDFRNVLWVGLGTMENVEHVKGVGYRLKK